MAQLLANNGFSTLFTGITSGAGTLTVASAASFPAIVNLGVDYFYLTLSDPAETMWEVVKVTGISGNTFTVTRAQDGTTALAWATGCNVQMRPCAQMLRELTGAGQLLQSQLVTIGANITNSLSDFAGPWPIANGVQVATYTVTPTVVGSRIRVRGVASISAAGTGTASIAVYLGTPTNANAASIAVTSSGYAENMTTVAEMVTTSLAPITVSVRMGIDNQTAVTIPYQSVSMVVEEIGIPNTNVSAAVSTVAWNPDLPPATPSAYDDEFNATALNTSLWTRVNSGVVWQTVDQNTSVPGCLSVQTTAGSVYTSEAILQAIPAGDFTIFLKLDMETAAGANQEFGLILSTTNTTATGSQSGFGLCNYSNGWYPQLLNLTNFSSLGTVVGYSYEKVQYLKISRVGAAYTLGYSMDGKTWTTYSFTANGTPLYFGVFGYNNSSAAGHVSFEYFRYVANGAATNLPGGLQSIGSGIPAFGAANNGQILGVANGAPAWGNDAFLATETMTSKTWINGHPIYRKVVSLGALPNTTSATTAHGASPVVITSITGMAINPSLGAAPGTFMQLPQGAPATANGVGLYADGTNITVTTGSNESAYTSAYAILEYTKT